jgi:nucleotide-binding universal stress UspA family protein
MKKILVPSDFSPQALAAFKSAVEIASGSGGSVHVLHAIELPVPTETAFGVQPYYVSADHLEDFANAARKKFAKMTARLKNKKVKVTLSIRNASVIQAIADEIAAKRISLVVMGTQGASGWKEYILGSNAEKVVRHASVPVIAVRKPLTRKSIRNIVLPSTLETDTADFMSKVKVLQDFFRARIHVLYLNTPANFVSDSDSRGALELFAKHYKLKNYTLNVRSVRLESDGIIEYAKEVKANMIAMGTHARKGLNHLLMVSVTEEVVNHVQLPIWTYTIRRKK